MLEEEEKEEEEVDDSKMASSFPVFLVCPLALTSTSLLIDTL